MKLRIENTLSKLHQCKNPLIISLEIEFLLNDMLRNKEISFYEGYLINDEVLRFQRRGYTEISWNSEVSISNCISLMNQKLVADLFEDRVSSDKYKEFSIEAYKMYCNRKIPFDNCFIMRRFLLFLDSNNNNKLLNELLYMRNKYDFLSDDHGPYHVEYFPCHYFNFEEMLINKTKILDCYKEIKKDIECFLVELSLID